MRLRHSLARTGLVAIGALLACDPTSGVEYTLQFSVAGNYKDLVVAGYQVVGGQVVGNCSYTRITSGSGRGGRTIYTPVPQTCTWSVYGDLVSATAGAPAVPQPIAVVGTETIYAMPSSQLYTGYDAALPGGFVYDFGSHYRWLSPNDHLVLPQQPYTFTITLQSDGDMPLTVSAVKATHTLAKATLQVVSTSCLGQVAVGGTCDVTLTYNDMKVSSPSGLAYDTLTVHLTSDAGRAYDWVQGLTDEVKVPVDGG